MKIGILTYGRVANFGANLQCTSTYMYLQKLGHTPIYIYYLSKELYTKIENNRITNPQIQAHYDYFDSIVKNKTALCHTVEDINREIEVWQMDAIIVGADAVLQHHPLLSRIYLRKSFYFIRTYNITPDRMFPNLFWGCGIDRKVKLAMMSVSCQNSEFSYFSFWLKRNMKKALERFHYISVRDLWTQKMLRSINKCLSVTITPDPVFAFNYNMGDLIPSKESVMKKFSIPEKYVLISLFRQTLSKQCLDDLKNEFKHKGLVCVALPMPDEGINYQHTFDYVISSPLSPIDWYALIKYSKAYIGENMHPIVVCLHNSVPCFSIDNWGAIDIFKRPKKNGSSKVEDILRIFGVDNFHKFVSRGRCNISAKQIVYAIEKYPISQVEEKAEIYYRSYLEMMNQILDKLKE